MAYPEGRASFVAGGSNLLLVANEEEHSFTRTGPREADCLRCKSPFGVNSYRRKALIAHGVSCAKKHAHAELLAVAAVPAPAPKLPQQPPLERPSSRSWYRCDSRRSIRSTITHA